MPRLPRGGHQARRIQPAYRTSKTLTKKKASRKARDTCYVANLRRAWEELLGYRAQDESARQLRDDREQARVDELEGVFADREPVFETSWMQTVCDAQDDHTAALIAEGSIPGIRVKKVDGAEVIDIYSRINPSRYHPEGTTINPTPEEIRDFHKTGTLL